MFRVVIADDEERICKLIAALIGWDRLGLEPVGWAHNGPETVELVQREKPDILITDIRMPGCTGLQVIEQVKEQLPELEIVIISGYADFSYAQTAIRFGVGEYLLKPIDKAQLESTLKGILEKISARQASMSNSEKIREQNLVHAEKLKSSLIMELYSGQATQVSAQRLREEYNLQLREDRLRAICIKMDCEPGGLSEAGKKTVVQKAIDLLKEQLEESCDIVCLEPVRDSGIGFLNFSADKEEQIHHILKKCLQQLEVSRGLYGPVSFSVGLGEIVTDASCLPESFANLDKIVDERLIRGAGKILDRIPEPTPFAGQEILDYYMREIGIGIELQDSDMSIRILDEVRQKVEAEKKVRGYEILQLIHGMASFLLWKVDMDNCERELQSFDKLCAGCSRVEELFSILRTLQIEKIEQLISRQEDEAVRPIRLAKQYIQSHFSEPITQEMVSQQVGLSSTYFSVLFKKVEGDGFAKYLARIRMEEAKNLLRETSLPVAQICTAVGYNDVKHFTQVFDKYTGVKPSVFRKLYG